MVAESSSSNSIAVTHLQSENLPLSSPQPPPNTSGNNPLSLLAVTPSIGSQIHRKRRRPQTASTNKEDEVLTAWLASEIKANAVKEELAKEK